ncbi:unnamed protein product [Protopolystoma xenopodis]|uniref:Uncharacterized protein n=1 Tax=Protopolystoma xenopodis TaxID=117903 RepID=A0A448X981_9PLAT|nr:unnamed protein product [Protopolystoma xenopodis]
MYGRIAFFFQRGIGFAVDVQTQDGDRVGTLEMPSDRAQLLPKQKPTDEHYGFVYLPHQQVSMPVVTCLLLTGQHGLKPLLVQMVC